ncbi:MAG: energy transducer TonB, partial [Terriglobia bacterium]
VNTTQSSNVQQSQLPVNVQLDTSSLGNGGGVFIGNPNAGPATDAGGNAPLTPMVRIVPIYPPDAQYQGVQGSVSTCFTVNGDGSVSDPHVTGATSPQARQMLSQAALRTIMQWKFFPEKVNGKGVATPGVCQDIIFKINGSGGQ